MPGRWRIPRGSRRTSRRSSGRSRAIDLPGGPPAYRGGPLELEDKETRAALVQLEGWIDTETAFEKLSLVFAVLGVFVAVPSTVDWVQQKWSGTPSADKQLKELRELLTQRLQVQDAAKGDSKQPNDGQLKSGIEKDIGAAIETLAEGGKKEALAALERGDTKAAQAVLAEKIEQLDKARTGSAKKEAALYRQRGALAYLSDTRAALRDYAKAAGLDPEDAEGLIFLGLLQARAGDSLGAKQSFERAIALGDRPHNEKQHHWAYFLSGDIDAALGVAKPPWATTSAAEPLSKPSSSATPTTPNGSAISPSAMTASAISAPPAILRTPNGSAISPSAMNASATSAPPAATATARLKPSTTASTFESSSPRATPPTWIGRRIWFVGAAKLAAAGAMDKGQHLASGLAILKRLDAEGKLTADQKK